MKVKDNFRKSKSKPKKRSKANLLHRGPFAINQDVKNLLVNTRVIDESVFRELRFTDRDQETDELRLHQLNLTALEQK